MNLRGLTVVITIAISACGGPDSGPPQTDAPGQSTAPATTPTSDVTLPPALEQRDFSEKSRPTFEEYEEAVFATVACIQSQGYAILGPFLNSDLDSPIRSVTPGIAASLGYSYGVGDGPSLVGSPLSSIGAEEACRARFLDEVERWYFSASQEEINEWYARFRTCLEARSVKDVESVPDEDLTTLDFPVACLP